MLGQLLQYWIFNTNFSKLCAIWRWSMKDLGIITGRWMVAIYLRMHYLYLYMLPDCFEEMVCVVFTTLQLQEKYLRYMHNTIDIDTSYTYCTYSSILWAYVWQNSTRVPLANPLCVDCVKSNNWHMQKLSHVALRQHFECLGCSVVQNSPPFMVQWKDVL